MPTVHNEILRRRSDLVELLYRPYPRSRLGEEQGGEDIVYLLPVFGLRDGRFTSHYLRTYIEAAQRLPATPRLTDAQWAAIDLLHEVADDLCYRMRLEPGDIQFLNNYVIYHGRYAFSDDAASGQVRAMYRLWLAMPNSRALPEELQSSMAADDLLHCPPCPIDGDGEA
ncbi:MAG TPA: TauD/TfdA family dioxygenase, partial [Burkholderiales bacterium]|nr:TauD/TfdA family dioxygenase [Burkholderiales bacterium]